MEENKHIKLPVYSLDQFQTGRGASYYQVEVFDANRHFKVSYPHRHDFYEVLYIDKGTGYHIIDNNKYEVKPPCVFFLSPGQAHKLELSHDIAGFIFLFTAEFYLMNQNRRNRLLEYPFFFSVDRINPPLDLRTKHERWFIKSLFERGCAEMSKGDNSSEDIVRSLLDLILLSCDQIYPGKYNTIKHGKGHFLVKQFLVLLEENYQKNLRISDYADKLAVTPNHLTQMVRQITGRTSTEILHEKQVLEIKRLLRHTNMSVSEIAELMHFDDQSYFTKYFKKVAGKTPLQFRKESMKST